MGLTVPPAECRSNIYQRISLLQIIVFSACLCWNAIGCAPVRDEFGQLVAGIAYWQFGNTSLYRVNPPLVRALGSLPAVAMGMRLESEFDRISPVSRYEHYHGEKLFAENPRRFHRALMCGRLLVGCIAVLGAIIIHRFVSQIAGPIAGMIATGVWCCQPQVIANGSMVLTDVPFSVFALVVIWIFLDYRSRANLRFAFLLGFAIGMASLVKFTGVLLWILPLASVCIPIIQLKLRHQCLHTAVTLLIAVVTVNAFFDFDGFGRRVDSFGFRSNILSGLQTDQHLISEFDATGNRFQDSPLAWLPVPFPSDYVLGLDQQQRDFDHGLPSYACGVNSDHGWWWFYLLVMFVKMPFGVLFAMILAIVFFRKSCQQFGMRCSIILATVFVLLLVHCLQSGFAQQSRYILCIYPLLSILIGMAYVCVSSDRIRQWICILIVAGWLESGWNAPYWMSAFNLAASAVAPPEYWLFNDATDWGQDFYIAMECAKQMEHDFPGRFECLVPTYLPETIEAFEVKPASPMLFAEGIQSDSNCEKVLVSTSAIAMYPRLRSTLKSWQQTRRIGNSYVVLSKLLE
jgi:hypothetical protein